jgi:polar amino acid transport system substrate-binding protein
MAVRHRYLWAVPAVALAVALGGCASRNQPLSPPDVAVPAGAVLNPTVGAQDELHDCDPRRSLQPSSTPPDWVLRQKHLVVGVDQADVLMSSWNPGENKFEGFNIDLVTAIVKEIWPGDDPEDHLRFTVVPGGAGSFGYLSGGSADAPHIDLVATSLTATCTRAKAVTFSEDYLDSGQTVLVRKKADGSPEFAGLEEMGGKRLCAGQGTTSIEYLSQYRTRGGASFVLVAAPQVIDCLVLLREHQVDGVSTDHQILLGFAHGAPDLTLVTEAPYGNASKCEHHNASPCTWFTDEPHGFAAARNADGEALIKYVNHVLDEMRADGRWQQFHDAWLAGHPDAGPPSPSPCPSSWPCR